MEKNLPDFDKALRDKIDSMEGLLNADVWKNIENQLDKDDAGSYKRKFIIFRNASACLLVLFVGLGTYNLIHTNSVKRYLPPKNNIASGNQKTTNATEISDGGLVDGHSTGKVSGNKKKSTLVKVISTRKQLMNTPHKIISKTIPQAHVFSSKNQSITFDDKPLVITNNQAFDSIRKHNLFHYPPPSGNNSELKKDIDNLNKEAALNDENVADLPKLKGSSQVLSSEADSLKHQPVVSIVKNIKGIKKASHFSIGGYFAPEYIGYNLENDEANKYDDKDKIESRENSELSFSANLLVGYALDKHWSMESGLSFSSAGISINKSKIFAEKIIAEI